MNQVNCFVLDTKMYSSICMSDICIHVKYRYPGNCTLHRVSRPLHLTCNSVHSTVLYYRYLLRSYVIYKRPCKWTDDAIFKQFLPAHIPSHEHTNNVCAHIGKTYPRNVHSRLNLDIHLNSFTHIHPSRLSFPCPSLPQFYSRDSLRRFSIQE